VSANIITKLKAYFKPLERTILHPQWLSYRGEVLEEWVASIKEGALVLDIGCADRWPEKHMPTNSQYIGLDYFETALEMYDSNVDIYANAESLPFDENSIDTILMFDVFEHINQGEKALREVFRVLKMDAEYLTPIVQYE